MARKKKHEEHENHERWLVSYADFITLLFAFFVVMYSLSAINEGKFKVLSESLVAAFRSQPKSLDPLQVGTPVRSPKPSSLDPLQMPAVPPIAAPMPVEQSPPAPTPSANEVMKEMADEIEKAMEALIEADLLTVRRKQWWIEVEIKTSILFASGSARVEPAAMPVLEHLAAILAKFPNPIHVEGFTDNVPINTVAFPSNWELSAGRAASVVHLFMRNGVPPGRMAAIGFGEHRPVADNATESGRNKNRRVVIVVMADKNARDITDLLAPQDSVQAPAEEIGATSATEAAPIPPSDSGRFATHPPTGPSGG